MWKQPLLEQTVPEISTGTDAYQRVVQGGDDDRRRYALSDGSAAGNRDNC